MTKKTFSISEEEDKTVLERGQWNRKIEYLLSMIGYCVGLGNLWRFPYICLRNGGGAFLIPYVLCLLLFGIPLYFLETSVAQFTSKGALHVWDVCPIFKGIGIGMVVSIVITGIYYNVILAWTMYYVGNAFISPLPWATCGNEWNSINCITDRSKLKNVNQSIDVVFNETNLMNGESDFYNSSQMSTNSTNGYVTSQEEFWRYNALQMSSGIHEIGNVNWRIFLCSVAAWTLMALCILKGIRSVGKVVYVTAVLPYVLLTVVLIRGVTLEGSLEGIITYIKPEFESLLKPQVWMEAAVQVFYSLGATWGPLFTMASYNKFNNNCLRDAVVLSCFGEGTSVYAGFIIFSVLGFMSARLAIPLKSMIASGPGLAFIVYPEALAQLPGANAWSVLFFFMLLLVGLDSQFAFNECIVSCLTDSFPSLRKRGMQVVVLVCLVQFLLGILLTTEGGIYLFQIVDWYIAAFFPPLFGLLECVVFGWIYGMRRFSEDIRMMLGRGVPVILRICICVVTPTILFIFFIYNITSYKSPNYGSYKYPKAAIGFGIFISILPLIPVVVCGIIAVKKSPGDSFKSKLKTAFKPTANWKPADKKLQSAYYEYENENNQTGTLIQRIRRNILG